MTSAEDTKTVSVTTTTETEGNGVKTRQVKVVAVTLVVCVVIMGAVATMCIFKKPDEWTLVTTVVNNLQALALLLAGGLLGATKPTSH